MIELSSEARKAYEVMVSSLEQTNQSEAEQAENVEINDPSLAEEPDPDAPQPEEPEYSKSEFWSLWTGLTRWTHQSHEGLVLINKPKLEDTIWKWHNNQTTIYIFSFFPF